MSCADALLPLESRLKDHYGLRNHVLVVAQSTWQSWVLVIELLFRGSGPIRATGQTSACCSGICSWVRSKPYRAAMLRCGACSDCICPGYAQVHTTHASTGGSSAEATRITAAAQSGSPASAARGIFDLEVSRETDRASGVVAGPHSHLDQDDSLLDSDADNGRRRA